MKQHIFCFLITIIGLVLFGQNQPMILENFTIKTEKIEFNNNDSVYPCKVWIVLKDFTINGVKQKLNNNYNLYFVYQDENEKTIHIPTIKNDTFYLSDVLPVNLDTKYYWLLKYEETIYYFHYGRFLLFKTPATMEIIIETDLYYKQNKSKWNYECPSDIPNDFDYQGIVFVHWLEYNGGLRACKNILDFESYLQEGRDILGCSTTSAMKNN